ncbi:uncharacterized protein LOC135201354 [Macrobrachium nipponense]|uniref:uncharacterized protein LOC135201354 n=1 Tax=Macrobrachium nipponense TaxID=159736 RepID=UPI0030C80F09
MANPKAGMGLVRLSGYFILTLLPLYLMFSPYKVYPWKPAGNQSEIQKSRMPPPRREVVTEEKDEKEEPCIQQYQNSSIAPKVVVIWTAFWGSWAYWNFMANYSKLRENRCAFWRCEFVWTYKESRARINDADAVMFFSFDFNPGDLPPRKPHQLWIRLELEAPPLGQQTLGAWSAAEKNGSYFNLTMSYHHLSNISAYNSPLRPLGDSVKCPIVEGVNMDESSRTYQKYIEHLKNYDDIMNMERSMQNKIILSQKEKIVQEILLKYELVNGSLTISEKLMRELQQTPQTSTDASQSKAESTSYSAQEDEQTTKKFQFTEQEVRWALRPKIASWMASHCPTASRRESFVAALQKFVNVTTIGRCGKLKCGRNHFDIYCYRWLTGSHLFYLSWENSLCEDYSTEKLWRPMQYGMVPVVYGGGDYDKILPPGSYINSRSFQNVSALAEYLLYLSNNPVSYLRYLQWRRFWEIKDELPWTCNICNTLHKVAGLRDLRDTRERWVNDTSDCYAPFI